MTPDLLTDLRALRGKARGSMLRGIVSLRCEHQGCPVGVLQCYFTEGDGAKPMQEPLKCPRCAGPLSYSKLSPT
jgi:hypothetical protein